MLMPFLVVATACFPRDTIRVELADQMPAFDGVVSATEWGSATLTLPATSGRIQIWIKRSGESVFLAFAIPDSTPFWGDELVISFDTRGDRAPNPQHDDFEWVFRRTLDSSVVYRGNSGTWMPPRGDPDWRIGGERSGGGWEVRSASDESGWSVELKLEEAWFEGNGGAAPGLALGIYDNDPRNRAIWPPSSDLKQPTMLERMPNRWCPILLDPR